MTKHKQGSSRAAAPSWAVAYQIHLDMADCGHPGFLRDKHGLPMLHTPDDFRGLGFKLDSTGNVEPLHRPLPRGIPLAHLRQGPRAHRPVVISAGCHQRDSLEIQRASYARKSCTGWVPPSKSDARIAEVDHESDDSEDTTAEESDVSAVGIAY